MTNTIKTLKCPNCGGSLPLEVADRQRFKCDYCGVTVASEATPLDPIGQVQQMYLRKEKVNHQMDALMEHYVELLSNGDQAKALLYMEAFTYLTLWTSYNAETLWQLERAATPAVRESARQLGINYVTPRQRGEVISWDSIGELLKRTRTPI